MFFILLLLKLKEGVPCVPELSSNCSSNQLKISAPSFLHNTGNIVNIGSRLSHVNEGLTSAVKIKHAILLAPHDSLNDLYIDCIALL